MNTHIIDDLRRAYDAFSRGDIQGAVDALDPHPDILWSEPESFYAGGTYRGPQGVSWLLGTSVRKQSFFFGFSCRFFQNQSHSSLSMLASIQAALR
jgi:hypothetical protein